MQRSRTWSRAAAVPVVALTVTALLQGALAIGQNRGFWGPLIKLPVIPVAAAVLPSNELLVWAAFAPNAFKVNYAGYTDSAVIDLKTLRVTRHNVTNTKHDMFCPGTAMTANGLLVVNGGDTATQTSIYNTLTKTWAPGARMNIPRAYSGSAALSDGKVFTMGGSWGLATGTPRQAEVWTQGAGWRLLPGINTAAINGADGSDEYAWFFALDGGRVFHAGPSAAMHFFGTAGQGSSKPAGLRGDSGDTPFGNAVMYAPNKILTVGGSTALRRGTALSAARVITLGPLDTVTVEKVAPMAFPRAFCNSVVLPDGNVITFGGQTVPAPFTDTDAVLSPELWTSASRTWRTLAPAAVARNYHSVAVLLPDGRIFSGGGGLCTQAVQSWCPTLARNHLDAQIFTPPYLLNADGTPASRPVILAAPPTAATGTVITVSTDRPVVSFVLIRSSAVTHSTNTDQRRIPLNLLSSAGTTYKLQVPFSTGVAVPGYYLLFVLDARGVPSVAKFIRIAPAAAPPPKYRTCRLVGKAFVKGWQYSQGQVSIPVAFRATQAQFCTDLLLRRAALGVANAVVVTDGSRGLASDFSCLLKKLPAQVQTVPDTVYPKSTLVVLNGAGGLC